MNFSSEALPYLQGSAFSNGFVFKFSPSKTKSESRLSYLETLCRGKKVIHIGFADHLPIIQSKITRNEWLHKRLVDVADLCVGIDINGETVEYVKSTFNIANLYTLDVIKDEVPVELQQQFDYMILGEVLEHVDNPVLFLNSLKVKYGQFVSKIIITVPNAFSVQSLPFIFRSQEFVNTDHRFWFTPYTLAKVGNEAGLELDSFNMCQTYRPKRWWQNLLVKRYPLFRENLIMTFKI